MAKYSTARFFSIPSTLSPRVSPDDSKMLYISDVTGTPQLYLQELAPAGKTTQLTFELDRVTNAWFCPEPGSEKILFSRDIQGNENDQLFVTDYSGTPEELLTGFGPDVMNTFGMWVDNGKAFLFSNNMRNPYYFDIYKMDVESGKYEMFMENNTCGYLANFGFSPDGKSFLYTIERSYFDFELHEMDLATGNVAQIFPNDDSGEKLVRYMTAKYTQDGNGILVETDYLSENLYIGKIDRVSHKIQTILADADHDLENLTVSKDYKRMAVTRNIDGKQELVIADPESGKISEHPFSEQLQGGAALEDHRLLFSGDGGSLFFSLSASTHPSEIYQLQMDEKKLTKLTRNADGCVDPSIFSDPVLIHYPSFDKDENGNTRMIPAWLYKPLGGDENTKYPAVVFPHGGPEGEFKPFFNQLIQLFVYSGFIVLAPNIRGSTGYGKSYSHLDDVENRLDSVKDIAQASLYLKTRADVYPEKVGIYGKSYGGFMALASLTYFNDIWAFGVDVMGLSSFTTFLENTSDYRREHRSAEYGTLERDREFLDEISPIKHCQNVKNPFMIMAGKNDARVPATETKQVYEKILKTNPTVRYIVFDDEGHFLAKKNNKVFGYSAIVDFMKKNVA